MRNRRGAMLALAAIVMVLMLSLLAFTIDLSRMYAQKNQLQTAADAAALAAVIQLLNDTTSVPGAASTYSQSNKVFLKAIAVPAADVVCGTWDDAAATFFTASACGSAQNAVTVTVRDSASYLSAVLLGRPAKQLTATSRGWLAFVGGAPCFTPWGIPYQVLTKLLSLDTLNNVNPLRDLTASDLQRLRTRTPAALTFRLTGGGKVAITHAAGILIPGESGTSRLSGGNANSQCLLPFQSGTQLNVDTINEGFDTGAGLVGRLVTAVLFNHTADCSSGCTVTLRQLVSFFIDGFQDNDVIGHFAPTTIGGSVSSTPSTVRRPILVK